MACGQAPGITKLAATEIDQGELESAMVLATKIMEGQRSGSYYILNEDEATTEMSRAFTRELQATSYDKISGLFGDYESLRFAEAIKIEGKNLTAIV